MANSYLLRSADANRARGKIPTGQEAEKAGEQVGKEGVSNIEEAVFFLPCHLSLYDTSWYTRSTKYSVLTRSVGQQRPHKGQTRRAHPRNNPEGRWPAGRGEGESERWRG